jgi:hypothetical protein
MKKYFVRKGNISASRECAYWIAYCDFSTGEIFIHQFNDCNSWTKFDDDNIRPIAKGTGKYGPYGASNSTTKELIDAAEDYAENSGKCFAPIPVLEN